MNTKDYALTLKVRNAPLLNAINEAGYPSALSFCNASKVQYHAFTQYLNLKETPFKADGITLTKHAQEISDFLGLSIDALFPLKHLTVALPQNEFEVQVSTEEMAALVAPVESDPSRIADTMGDVFAKMIASPVDLSERERKILTLRYQNDMRYTDIGVEMGVSGNRIAQIEAKALRKLRHPTRLLHVVAASGIYAESFEKSKHWGA